MKVLLKLSKNKTNKKSIDYYEEVKIAYIQCEHMRKHFDSLRLSTTSTQITKDYGSLLTKLSMKNQESKL